MSAPDYNSQFEICEALRGRVGELEADAIEAARTVTRMAEELARCERRVTGLEGRIEAARAIAQRAVNDSIDGIDQPAGAEEADFQDILAALGAVPTDPEDGLE